MRLSRLHLFDLPRNLYPRASAGSPFGMPIHQTFSMALLFLFNCFPLLNHSIRIFHLTSPKTCGCLEEMSFSRIILIGSTHFETIFFFGQFAEKNHVVEKISELFHQVDIAPLINRFDHSRPLLTRNRASKRVSAHDPTDIHLELRVDLKSLTTFQIQQQHFCYPYLKLITVLIWKL